MKKITVYLLALLTVLSACKQGSTKKQQLDAQRKDIYLKQGGIITGLTFGALSSELKKALVADGVAGAVKYCKLKAHPIVDSLSNEYDVKIKRTTMQLRNKSNAPTMEEKAMLDFYHSRMDEGNELQPEVKTLKDGTVAFYAPITINTPLCLNCHGKLVESVMDENYKVIKELYPEDEAIGYELNDLRGMWSITFNSVLDKK